MTRRVLPVALALVCSVSLAAQTPVKPPKNKYTPEQDVQLGKEAAAEVRRQYPIITDERITSYLESLGRDLVEVAPPDLNNPLFEYSFTPVNLKEINAFALPGGPMFVNRGMMEAAQSEGEVVGVMAHELAHVLLRHGTANATKAQGFQLGALAGAITGAIIGGGWGELISQGSQFGLGTWLLKYSRDYEKQADILGAQMMARAGYDPRDLGRMFETISKQSEGSGAPEWLSSHPNPGNRSQYIAQEAAKLQIAQRPERRTDLQDVKAQFASLPPAQSMAELARRESGPAETTSVGTPGKPVPAPSAQYRRVQGGRLFQVQVPSNWQALASNNSIKYVPENGYGQYEGQSVFTHGVELGVARASSRNLADATSTLVQALARANPDLRQAGDARTVRISGRQGIAVPLVNRSALSEEERIGLYTTFLADGNLFYYLTIVPADEAQKYAPVFDRIGNSIRLNDGR
ncbi:MAG TPA: M48 family metallopeptidase [Vicinamibacterales bacterium]